MKKNILITGGDGYVGHRVALQYLKNSDANLLLWVRSDDLESLNLKKKKISNLIPEQYKNRYKVYGGNLNNDSAFEEVPKEEVHYILHTAAVIKFNVEEDVADSVNIAGTKRILSFAKECPHLKSFVYISTVYSAGEESGMIDENFHQNPNFVNHYERSKYESEMIIKDGSDDLPWKIIRIATVISDDESGEVTQYNVFHNTIRLLYNGLVSLLPGDEDTPLYLVTGKFVSESIFEIMQNDEKEKIYHVCHNKEESANLLDLIDYVYEVFNKNESFVKKRIMRPIFANEKTFNVLADNMEALSSEGVVSDAFKSIKPFSRQLFISKEFLNTNTLNSLKSYKAPKIKELIQNTTQYLIDTKWGRDK